MERIPRGELRRRFGEHVAIAGCRSVGGAEREAQADPRRDAPRRGQPPDSLPQQAPLPGPEGEG
eukprot:10830401-Lingulodinium_polyedra.AAC.1